MAGLDPAIHALDEVKPKDVDARSKSGHDDGGMSRGLVAAAALLLASCSFIPAYQRPAVEMPAAFQAARPGATAPSVDAAWWRTFRSAELDGLIERALAANQDLEAARQRVEQARATVRANRASLFPSLDASGSIGRTRTHSQGTRSGSFTTLATPRQGALTASYEADFWGLNAANVASAEQLASASEFAREAAALVVQAEVVSTYVDALATRDRLAIARQNLATALQVLDVVRARVREGAASSLDLAQQESSLATVQAAIPALEQQLHGDQTALAVLVGRAPEGFAIQSPGLAALSFVVPDPGQPSTLLVRRPDVRQAEAQLVAANADIGAARAAFLPAVFIDASGTVSAIASGGTSTVYSLLASATAPLFDGGRRQADLDRTRARFAELVAGYRQAVLAGLKETEDSLVAVDTSARRAGSLSTAAERAAEAYRVARERYAAGATDFLTVLDSQRTLLSAQDSLAQAQADRFLAALNLYRALGGGWAAGRMPG